MLQNNKTGDLIYNYDYQAYNKHSSMQGNNNNKRLSMKRKNYFL